MTLVSRSDVRRSYTVDHRAADYNHSLWAYYILRPAAFYLTPFFLRLGFSATGVTLLALVILISGLLLIALADSRLVLVTGAALVNVFYVLDFVDGNIARYKKAESLLGELLDFLSGILFHVLMPLSVACYLHRSALELSVPLSAEYQYPAAAWWYVGIAMSLMFLLRRVVNQKMQITFPASDGSTERRASWQVALRSLEAVKTPILLVAGMLLFLDVWLLFYASYGAITLLGLVGIALYRAKALDGARRGDGSLHARESGRQP